MKAIIISVMICSMTSGSVYAQEQPQVIKRSVATVLFSSIGGAILGLSTLSFYGEPQEHTDNIAYGAILGVVGGISYLSYRGMQRPAYDPNTFSELEINENRKLLAISKANKPAMFNVYFEF